MICLSPTTEFKYHCAVQHANPDWLVQAEENTMTGPNFSEVIWAWFESMNLNLNHSFVMQNSVYEKPPLYRPGKLKKTLAEDIKLGCLMRLMILQGGTSPCASY